MKMSRGRIARIRKGVLHWYATERRDLPWRKRPTPYRVWVSEVILQQTRVQTAIPYFREITRRFPTLRSLSRAKVDDLLGVWSGLGYYRRARNLHSAVREVADRYGGKVPRSEETLLSLPGVGRYTAGAIRSIAFGERAAAIDGNTERVVARLQGFRGDPRRGEGARAIRRWTEALVPPRAPGEFNQGLMEIGARICIPRRPRCGDCPVRGSCRGRRAGTAGSIPPPTRSTTRTTRLVSAVIRRNGRILLARRPIGGPMEGLWELPGGEPAGREKGEGAIRRIVRETVGLEVRVGNRLAGIRHAIMDRQIRGTAYDCRPIRGRVRPRAYDACRWLRRDEVPGLPITGATRKYLPSLPPRSSGDEFRGQLTDLFSPAALRLRDTH